MAASGSQYCGECFELFDAGLEHCPRCGWKVTALSHRDYQQKLVHALEHPLAEVRMRAIIALGLRGERSAADALVGCALRSPSDVIEGLEVVRSLSRVLAGTGDFEPLRRLAENHPAHAIQAAAILIVRHLGEGRKGKLI